ncbi:MULTISPECIES: ATP-grasp domain-containing protein [unclassified Paraburkholderia]|uniref:ATP-grasp domain-containing protein n=1 Tax=unclassified Paraburkholderia TaxID=2615204 RepID=UPI002AB0BEE8|nr:MULTISPECIES: ATP-grasp domain-containing protein [unclassified Paraburkholderia]
MKSDGVLILSHCGFSFVEDLVAACRARGLAVWILTSVPLPEHGQQRIDTLRTLADETFVGATHDLGTSEVESALASLREQNLSIRGCISVWEGYRALMAYANALQGISDLPWERLYQLRNKLVVRRKLRQAGLSNVDALALTASVLDDVKRDGKSYFVKPIHGIASYGAFRLTTETDWSTLEAIVKQARHDTVYTAVLGGQPEFLAESFVDGTEYSFEVLAVNGKRFVAGIHEKCQLTEDGGTVLENSCTSPPTLLTSDEIAAGIAWIDAISACLKLDWGCFHIEARFNGRRWELIEINPRVGGSLISQSVKALNQTASVLELWLDQLVSQSGGMPSTDYLRLISELSYSHDGVPPTDLSTFFRVYFASPGRIESIQVESTDPAPTITHVLLKAGDVIETSAREVFLGQILWNLPREQRDRELPHLIESSVSTICVQYVTEKFREDTVA